MPPLVTCICPTANRRDHLRRAIDLFLAQDYPNKRLVIVEDGEELNADVVPIDAPIGYVHLGAERRTIGEKRNIACERASDGLIAHWDDDDWQARRRLSAQVAALGDADLCGLDRLVFYNGTQAWLYKSRRKPWLVGATLMYRPAMWEKAGHFDLVSNGEDTAFIDKVAKVGGAIVPVTDESLYVCMLHGGNTVERKPDPYQWSAFPVDTVRGWMAAEESDGGT